MKVGGCLSEGVQGRLRNESKSKKSMCGVSHAICDDYTLRGQTDCVSEIVQKQRLRVNTLRTDLWRGGVEPEQGHAQEGVHAGPQILTRCLQARTLSRERLLLSWLKC